MDDLRERVEQILADQADDILAMVETAIRADERTKVKARATSDEAVKRANAAYNYWDDNMRAAILAALDGEGGE